MDMCVCIYVCVYVHTLFSDANFYDEIKNRQKKQPILHFSKDSGGVDIYPTGIKQNYRIKWVQKS